jgi:hypothetical protein
MHGFTRTLVQAGCMLSTVNVMSEWLTTSKS